MRAVSGETNTANNNVTDGLVAVTMVGDFAGRNSWPDGRVDMRDVGAVARLFGFNYPSPKYTPNCDIDNNGKIDMQDIGIFARHFGQTDP